MLASALLIAGCIGQPAPRLMPTEPPADIPTALPRLTPTSNLSGLHASPEPNRNLISSPSLRPTAIPTISQPWEPRGIFFEEEGSIYRIDFDGSNRQLIIPGEHLISVSPDGTKLISSGDSGLHLVSSTGERAELPPAYADRFYWSQDSRDLILLRTWGNPQEENEYERWSISPVKLQSQFRIDGELIPIGIGGQGNLLLETLNASDYDPGPLDYRPGYYIYDDRRQELLQIGAIDLSIQAQAIGGRRYATLSPRGDRMAISFDGINIWVLDLHSRTPIRKTTFSGKPYPGGVGIIVWSPQETRLAFEQFEIYHRDTGRWENRLAVLDLESNEIAIVSDEAIFERADLPSDFPLHQGFLQPAAWNESGTNLFVYFEVTALRGQDGHRDDPDYPQIRRLHSFWRLSIDTLTLEAIPWLEGAHAIFPRYGVSSQE